MPAISLSYFAHDRHDHAPQWHENSHSTLAFELSSDTNSASRGHFLHGPIYFTPAWNVSIPWLNVADGSTSTLPFFFGSRGLSPSDEFTCPCWEWCCLRKGSGARYWQKNAPDQGLVSKFCYQKAHLNFISYSLYTPHTDIFWCQLLPCSLAHAQCSQNQ